MRFEIRPQATDEMQRVSRKELGEKFDELLETVTRENVGIVITDEGKDDLVLCPASWVNLFSSKYFDIVLDCALKYVIEREDLVSGSIIKFIEESMDLLDATMLVDINNTIENLLDKENGDKEWVEEWLDFQERLKERLDKYKAEFESKPQKCFYSIKLAMHKMKKNKENAYEIAEQAISAIKKGAVINTEDIDDFQYLLMDYGDDVRFYELYKLLYEVLKEKYPQLIGEGGIELRNEM